MPPTMTEEEIRKLAKARAGFKVHALVYLVVNVFLALIWFVTMGSSLDAFRLLTYWPIWPHLGWGVGLAIHGAVVYGLGVDLEGREAAKLRQKYGGGPS